jgi:hypothetical protein
MSPWERVFFIKLLCLTCSNGKEIPHFYRSQNSIQCHQKPTVKSATNTIECALFKKESRNRPGVAQRVPGGLGSQIFMTFGTWRWWGRQPHTPAAFTPRNVPGTHFHQGLSRLQGHGVGRKYVTEKSSDITGNRSRDRPTSSAAH